MDEEPQGIEQLEEDSPSDSSLVSRHVFSLQHQVTNLEALVRALLASNQRQQDLLEEAQNRTNRLAGVVDQIQIVQERLSHRIGQLEERERVAEAQASHQEIVCARLSRRLEELERLQN